VLDVLRVGVYQLRSMDVATYAAVSETVDLAPKRARGFVNAILRKASSTDVPPDSLATELAHPEWLLARWMRTYGAERARRIAEANQQLSYPDVLSDEQPTPNAQRSSLVDGIWRLDGPAPEGMWAMDEGSAVIAAIAAASSGDILDLAAAPGSKTLYMRSRGAHVVANDVSIARLQPLARRAKDVVVSDGRQIAFRRRFRTVLIDAPCSATGTIRRNPELKWRLREADITRSVSLQRELLAAAMELASETVIYSTCSLEPEENDAVVAGYERIDIARFAPPGTRPWIEDGVLRLTPDSGADGFTAFALRVSSRA
jgi:16S rRNA (cytosine967-C5)-methyltransferase